MAVTRKQRRNLARRLRPKKPELAEILYEAWRRAPEFDGITPTWNVITPKERQRWEAVADAARDWAHENVQWEE